MSSPTSIAPKWQLISQRKKDEQKSRIPQDWLLESAPSPDIKTYLDIPRKSGLLSEQELRITEDYDATALAEEIKSTRLKSVDVVRAFCKRAALAHQLTNCLTEILFTDALTRAEELDAHIAAGKPALGPLHGVPVSLKDTFKIRGYDASIGIAALCFKPAEENSALVDVLLRAGAVLYCKTNVPQTLMALDSHNNVFGRTLNPFNALVTAGGSSGGEGALLGMRGSVLGVGTDVGGSIRIPAMCNGTFGLKPSWQRVPYAGQEGGTPAGLSKVGIPASAGPLAHSARDVELFFRAVSDQKPWEADPDVLPSPWTSLSSTAGRRLRLGVVRTDGVVTPHPPILRLLDEVSAKLERSGIEVVDLDITPLFSRCQSLANALFTIEGGNHVFDLLDSTSEPLSPWLRSRTRRQPPASFDKLTQLHARKTELQTQFLRIWRDSRGAEIDALVCPVAPHPVPPIDRWNAASYTSSFVLLDYPAGVVPVRRFERADMRGEMGSGKAIGSWDVANRKLWTDFDREVYIGTPLCVQIVARRLEERRLCEVMAAVDGALKSTSSTPSAKL